MYWVSCLVLAVAAAGCASKSYDKGTATAQALQTSADQITVVSTKITDSLGALNNLTFKPQGDLRTQYDAYVTAVKGLQTSTTDLDKKVTDVQTLGMAYLQNWSNQLATIKSPEIRSLSTARKEIVSTKLQSVNQSYQQVKTNLQPFTVDLTDIQTALGTDLTTGGVDSVKDVVAKTKVDAVPLRDSVKKLQSDFSDLSAALSPVIAH